jgi:hypothetical protein
MTDETAPFEENDPTDPPPSRSVHLSKPEITKKNLGALSFKKLFVNPNPK